MLLGIGNPLKGDAGTGIYIAERLNEYLKKAMQLRQAHMSLPGQMTYVIIYFVRELQFQLVCRSGGMVDALRSGRSVRKGMGVRISPSALLLFVRL